MVHEQGIRGLYEFGCRDEVLFDSRVDSRMIQLIMPIDFRMNVCIPLSPLS